MNNILNELDEITIDITDIIHCSISETLKRKSNSDRELKLKFNISSAQRSAHYKKLNIEFTEEQIYTMCLGILDFIWKFNLQNMYEKCTDKHIIQYLSTLLNELYYCEENPNTNLSESDVNRLCQYIMNQILCENINNITEVHNDFSEFFPKIINFVERIEVEQKKYHSYNIKNDGILLLVNNYDIFDYLIEDVDHIIMKKSIEQGNFSRFRSIMDQQISKLHIRENEIFTKYDLSENEMYFLRFKEHQEEVRRFYDDLNLAEESHNTLIEVAKQKIPNSIDDYGMMRGLDLTNSSELEVKNFENVNSMLNELKWMIRYINKIKAEITSHWNKYEKTKKIIKVPKLKKQNRIFQNYLDDAIHNRMNVEEVLYYISSALPYHKNKKVLVYDEQGNEIGIKKRKKQIPINYFDKNILDNSETEEQSLTISKEQLEEEQKKARETRLQKQIEKKLYAESLFYCLVKGEDHTTSFKNVVDEIRKQCQIHNIEVLHSGSLRTFISMIIKNENRYVIGQRYSKKTLENQSLSQIIYEVNKDMQKKYGVSFIKIEWTWNREYTEITLDEKRGIVEILPSVRLKGILK